MASLSSLGLEWQGGTRSMPVAVRTALVVDDAPLVRRIQVGYLRRLGFSNIFEAGSLLEARVVIRTEDPDLVLLDLSFSDGDGLDLLVELNQEMPPPFVIVMTGMDHPQIRSRVMDQGVFAFMTKPVRLEALKRVIDSLPVAIVGTGYEPAPSSQVELGRPSTSWSSPRPGI